MHALAGWDFVVSERAWQDADVACTDQDGMPIERLDMQKPEVGSNWACTLYQNNTVWCASHGYTFECKIRDLHELF